MNVASENEEEVGLKSLSLWGQLQAGTGFHQNSLNSSYSDNNITIRYNAYVHQSCK